MGHRFYMDVHVPLAVTEGLRRCDVDVMTSQDDRTRETDDQALLHGQRTLIESCSRKMMICSPSPHGGSKRDGSSPV